MATLSTLVVNILGNTKQLTASLKKAEGRLGKFKNVAGKAFGALKSAGPAAATAAAAAIVGFAVGAIKNFADVGDELDKMSKRTGFSVEALGELRFAAEQSGASIGDIEKSLKRMASTVQDAGNGLSTATDAMDALGITIDQVQGKNPEEQFEVFAEALANVENASERAALAQDIFGRSGTALLPLLADGTEGMAALRQQARDLGIVMSGDAAASCRRLQGRHERGEIRAPGRGLRVCQRSGAAYHDLCSQDHRVQTADSRVLQGSQGSRVPAD